MSELVFCMLLGRLYRNCRSSEAAFRLGMLSRSVSEPGAQNSIAAFRLQFSPMVSPCSINKTDQQLKGDGQEQPGPLLSEVGRS